MFKFNNDHIFTGYLKQVLSSFHLPKCKVYTKEQQKYTENYLVNMAAWDSEIKNLINAQSQLAAEIEEITHLKETTSDEDYLALLEEVKGKYEEELSIVSTQIAKLQRNIATTPKELNILQTNPHSSIESYPADIPGDLPLKVEYPAVMRYIPYIKDGYLQTYDGNKWHKYHMFTAEHEAWHKTKSNPHSSIMYDYGKKIPNYTKNLKIQNTIYDSYTHEYLGEYLRFHRDFANINLMPLYNCFSNRACPHLDLEIPVSNTYKAKFKTDQTFETSLYKYYMVPVKFFKDYTIAIDCGGDIELCCCIYDEYANTDSDFTEIPKLTYQCLRDMQFKAPILYSGLQKLNPKLFDQTSDLCQHEDDLKLILKIPVNNKSSIVILEGDYTAYNDLTYPKTAEGLRALTQAELEILLTKSYIQDHQKHLEERPELKYDDNCKICELLKRLEFAKAKASRSKQTNKTVINYENLQVCEDLTDKLITPLQLLRANTGESYPFADRLVEYLVGNAITLNESIADNIDRVKAVMSLNVNPNIVNIDTSNSIWEPVIQCLAYDYINEKHNTHDINHDILGFIDKDVEKWYTAANEKTIANIDIYND